MPTNNQTALLPGFFTAPLTKKIWRLTILLLSFLSPVHKNYSQISTASSTFQIFGQLTGRDTGKVVIWYTNHENENIADTTVLQNGRFGFSGNVNIASECLIWTNINNIYFDDQSVIRFILQPGIVYISKTDGVQKVIITGLPAQTEKDRWDSVKAGPIAAYEKFIPTVDSLTKLSQRNGRSYKDQIDAAGEQRQAALATLTKLDIGYVASHPGSYLSAYLLGKRCRRIPVDSVVLLFDALADTVKNSALGYDVIKYAYPLTNDQSFRKKYPLVDRAFSTRLESIKSIHDFRLQDSSGKTVDLATFKGKYLVIDIWASWCKPCVGNFPAWNALIKQYDPDRIQFLSVSMDSNADAWKKCLARHKPGGLHVADHAAFKSLFAVYCKALWAPTYIIADPSGRIIQYRAPHPGDSAFKTLLEKLFKEGGL